VLPASPIVTPCLKALSLPIRLSGLDKEKPGNGSGKLSNYLMTDEFTTTKALR